MNKQSKVVNAVLVCELDALLKKHLGILAGSKEYPKLLTAVIRFIDSRLQSPAHVAGLFWRMDEEQTEEFLNHLAERTSKAIPTQLERLTESDVLLHNTRAFKGLRRYSTHEIQAWDANKTSIMWIADYQLEEILKENTVSAMKLVMKCAREAITEREL